MHVPRKNPPIKKFTFYAAALKFWIEMLFFAHTLYTKFYLQFLWIFFARGNCFAKNDKMYGAPYIFERSDFCRRSDFCCVALEGEASEGEEEKVSILGEEEESESEEVEERSAAGIAPDVDSVRKLIVAHLRPCAGPMNCCGASVQPSALPSLLIPSPHVRVDQVAVRAFNFFVETFGLMRALMWVCDVRFTYKKYIWFTQEKFIWGLKNWKW
jgi:hypothetical protein